MRARPFLTILAAATPLLLSSAAAAQVGARGPLPTDTITARTLDPRQVADIADFVRDGLARLADEDPAGVKAGRKSLQEPLHGAAPSAAFRQEYSRAISDGLSRLSKDARELVAINALLVAGDLATDRGIAVLDAALNDARPAVRYQAIAGLGRTIDAIDRGGALDDKSALAVVTRLGGLLAREADPIVVDRLILSLVEATEVTKPNFELLRPRAFLQLAETMSARIRALGRAPENEGMLRAALRVTTYLRDGLTSPQRPMGPEEIRAASALGGDLIAYTLDRLDKGDFPASGLDTEEARSRRLLVRDLVAGGETIVYFSLAALGAPPVQTNLKASFEAATPSGDTAFATGARQLVARGGILTAPPFGFAQDRFLPRP